MQRATTRKPTPKPTPNTVEHLKQAFRDVPFTKRTRITSPPGEEGIDLKRLLQHTLQPHPLALPQKTRRYWSDDWWGCERRKLNEIATDFVSRVFFVREGIPDDTEWLAVFSVHLKGEEIFLFVSAYTCYTGFGVAGGVHIYASKSLDRIKTLCMNPSQEKTAFGS
jgi:hypothetical protein